MTDHAHELSATAEEQITELIDLLSTLDHAALRRPCPGREKLGDATIGAAVRHTVDNYERIARFVLGQRRQDHANHNHGATERDNGYTAESVDLDAVLERLGAAREALRRVAELSDSQLDAIPPKDSFRFCDGQRTLEEVLAGLLKHQAHQVEALQTAAA